jgi:hypothetical protein
MATNDDADGLNGALEDTAVAHTTATDAGGAGNGCKTTGTQTAAEDEEPVGYGRPPKHSRFKPGRSGNPGGRPKSARGLRTLLREEMRERVSVTENGKTKKLSKLQIIVKRLFEKAGKGDARAISTLMELNIRVVGIEDDDNKAAPLTPEEQEILRNLKRRRFGSDAEAGHAGDRDLTVNGTNEEGDESHTTGGDIG